MSHKGDTGANFEEDTLRSVPPGVEQGSNALLILDIDGFEGPLDLLLDLARKQKVDLTRISILQLVRQYLIFIETARQLRLDLAAEYLVMAAWLAYMKSRLLLPDQNDEEEPGGAEMAESLSFQLQRLQAMRDKGEWLSTRPALYEALFPRGAAPGLEVRIQRSYDVTLYQLLSAYASIQRRSQTGTYRPAEFNLVSTEIALERLKEMLGHLPMRGQKSVWATLQSFLPEKGEDSLLNRSHLASTFLASLEMAKQGALEIEQEGAFRPIYLRRSGIDAEELPYRRKPESHQGEKGPGEEGQG